MVTTEQRVSECTCQLPIVRCAHYGDQSLYLENWHSEVPPAGKRFDVWGTWCGPAFYYGNNYDAALAAFCEAEERLLRGDA